MKPKRNLLYCLYEINDVIFLLLNMYFNYLIQNKLYGSEPLLLHSFLELLNGDLIDRNCVIIGGITVLDRYSISMIPTKYHLCCDTCSLFI
jgi:hypothetical protein